MVCKRALLLVASFSIATGLSAQGTSNTNYLTIAASQFGQTEDALKWVTTTESFRRYAVNQFNGVFITGVNLPSGALLTSMALDYCNTNTQAYYNIVGFGLNETDRLGNITQFLGSVTGAENTGCGTVSFDLTPLNYTVDNANKRIIATVSTYSGDETNQFAGVVIGYKLQVSAAPATPTFNDVPPSNPFYKYIEALAASGITAGCGEGNFCPDSPVTRAQMATFLAKALGLSFSTPP